MTMTAAMHSDDEKRRLNAQRGNKSKQAGKDWEGELETQLEIAELDKIVSFWSHTEPGFRLIWKPKPGRKPERSYLPVAAGFADFSGVLSSGLAFAIECKSTLKDRYHRSDISDEQQRHLEAVASSGGLSLFALRLHSPEPAPLAGLAYRRHDFLIPWKAVPWRKLRSADSVSLEQLAGWELRRPRALGRFLGRCACDRVVLIRPDGIATCGIC